MAVKVSSSHSHEPFRQHSSTYQRVKKWWIGKYVKKETSNTLCQVAPISKTTYSSSAESLHHKRFKHSLKKVASDPKLKGIPFLSVPQAPKPIEKDYTRENHTYLQELIREKSETICVPTLVGCHNLQQIKKKVRPIFQDNDKLTIILHTSGVPSSPFILFYRHPWDYDRVSFRYCSKQQSLSREIKKLKKEIKENCLYKMARASEPSKAFNLWKPLDPKQQASIKKLLTRFNKIDSKDILPLISDEYSPRKLREKFKEKIKLISKCGKDGSRHALEIKKPQQTLVFKQLYTMFRHISWQLSQPHNAPYCTRILIDLAVGSCHCPNRLKEEALQAYRQLTKLIDAPNHPSLPVLFDLWAQNFKDELLDLVVAELNVSETSHIRFGIAIKLKESGITVNAFDFAHAGDPMAEQYEATISKGFRNFLNYYQPSRFAYYCEKQLNDLLSEASISASCDYKAYIIRTLREKFEPLFTKPSKANSSENKSNIYISTYNYLLKNKFIIEDPTIDALETVTHKGMLALLEHLCLIQKV